MASTLCLDTDSTSSGQMQRLAYMVPREAWGHASSVRAAPLRQQRVHSRSWVTRAPPAVAVAATVGGSNSAAGGDVNGAAELGTGLHAMVPHTESSCALELS